MLVALEKYHSIEQRLYYNLELLSDEQMGFDPIDG